MMTKINFHDMNLSGNMLKAIAEMGFEECSHIQSESMPHILEGRDIIGQAQTGTGKTAAFAIPIIENIKSESVGIEAIILCPTRELVLQVSEEFRKLLKYIENISVLPIYGGQEIERQIRGLTKNPKIIIGTPGRTIDHIKRGTLKLNDIRFLVLDEADEMLDMGFREDIESIMEKTPDKRQTIMFSATMPDSIVKLMKKHQRNPVRIDVSANKVNTPKIEQYFYDVKEKDKPEALARLLDFYDVKLALVFCNTRNKVNEVVENLKSRGYFADGLHGEINQNQRDKVMASFRAGTVEILVATDVAGRGIDVNDIEAVFNYDLPEDDEDYIHRIGRTARAGKSGRAFSFIVGRQIYNLKRIQRSNEITIHQHQIPTLEELDETRLKSIKKLIDDIISKSKLGRYVNLVENIMGDDYVAMDIAAALLKSMIDQKNEGFDANKVFNYEPYSDKSFDNKNDKNRRKDSKKSRRKPPFRGAGNDSIFGRQKDHKKNTTKGKEKNKKKRIR